MVRVASKICSAGCGVPFQEGIEGRTIGRPSWRWSLEGRVGAMRGAARGVATRNEYSYVLSVKDPCIP